LLCSDGCADIRRERTVDYVLVTDKALFPKSVETGDRRHTVQFVANELDRVFKVWCPAMTRDRNAMIGIDAICLVNKLKQKYPRLQTIGGIHHLLNLIALDTIKSLDQYVNNIFKVITFVWSHHMAQVVLNEKQIALFDKTISPELPIKARWGSI
jgi:hypothetical protein